MTSSLVLTDTHVSELADEISIKDDQAAAFYTSARADVVLWGSTDPGTTAATFARLVSTVTTTASTLVALLAADDTFDDVAFMAASPQWCVAAHMVMTTLVVPPSDPPRPGEWVMKSLLLRECGVRQGRQSMNPGALVLVMRYDNIAAMSRVKDVLAEAIRNGYSGLIQLVRLAYAHAVSPAHHVNPSRALPAGIAPSLTSTAYTGAAGGVVGALAAGQSVPGPRSGSVSVSGVSFPVFWDVAFPVPMTVQGVGPWTHVWAFLGTDTPLRSISNQSDADVVVHIRGVTRLFFFPNMRCWCMLDSVHLFEAGQSTSSTAVGPVSTHTKIELSPQSRAMLTCVTPEGTMLTLPCNASIMGERLPAHFIGTTIARVAVSSTI